jgi:hypothetical protein
MDGDSPADGDEPDDGIARDRGATACDPHQHVVHSFHDDAGTGGAPVPWPRRSQQVLFLLRILGANDLEEPLDNGRGADRAVADSRQESVEVRFAELDRQIGEVPIALDRGQAETLLPQQHG